MQGCTSQVQYEWLRRKVPVPSAMDLYLRVTAGHCCVAEPKPLIGNLAPCGYEMGSSWSGRWLFFSLLPVPSHAHHVGTSTSSPWKKPARRRNAQGNCGRLRERQDRSRGKVYRRPCLSIGRTLPSLTKKKRRTSPLCISGNGRTGLRSPGLADRTWGKKHSPDGAAVEPLGPSGTNWLGKTA